MKTHKDKELVAHLSIIKDNGNIVKSFSVFEGDNIIGRSDSGIDVTIELDGDAFVSRCHAVLKAIRTIDQGIYFQIYDDGEYKGGIPSMNGTFLNGGNNKIIKGMPRTIIDGDILKVGATRLLFKIMK